MFKIHKRQFTDFEKASRADFVDRMVVHIKRFFPDHFAALQDEKTRELILFGIERAAIHKIVNERDVCKFIDLMVAFGPGFEEDPKCPWAGRILKDESFETPSVKVDRLYDEGLANLADKPGH